MKFGGWQRLNADYTKQFGVETAARLSRLKSRESRRIAENSLDDATRRG
jgi:hypothetical protein